MSTNIEGKVVVITGASSGLGESTARHLAKLGATVVLGARRKGRLDAIVENIQADGAKALAVSVDVTNRAHVEALVQKAIDTYGKIDVPRPNKEKAMSRNIERIVVVITGASSGLGESTARHLAE